MKIVDLTRKDQKRIEQTAQLLMEGFKGIAWPDMESALQEVMESLEGERISRIALDDDGRVRGWIGGISTRDGKVWELHPVVVDQKFQRQSIGTALVKDLEEQVRARGGLTIWLGTDDETYSTSLGGVNLFPNVLEHLANIKNINDHPFEFYLKIGYSIVGVMPDANGPGKPDIFMAKSFIVRS